MTPVPRQVSGPALVPLSDFRSHFRAGHGKIVIDGIGRFLPRAAFEQSAPPHGRVEGAGAVVQGRIDVRKEVPDVADHHPHDLVPGHRPMENQAEPHEHPRKVRGVEDEKAEEAEPRVWVPAGPNVDQCGGERVAEEGHRHQGAQENQARHGVEQQPREVGW